jgi:protein TonB
MNKRHVKSARIAVAAAGILAGCTITPLYEPTTGSSNGAGSTSSKPTHRESAAPVAYNHSTMSLDRYKKVLAQRIAEVNPSKVYPGNPQAMLRSVVVVKYVLDANGNLVSSDPLRTNGDTVATSTALGALRSAAPFPAPPSHLLSRGRVEILETMLFNDDGRFQMRSIASPQLDE